MRKLLVFSFFTLMLIFSGFAIEVDRPEIDSVRNRAIEFINYNGPHDVVDSVDTIRGIGSNLAGTVQNGRAGDMNRYAVIHCVDPETKEGLDADIFIIGKDAGVDHINNVRLIISGYLMSAYGYSGRDAATLAHFVTIYNAVYRGQMDFFNQKYKQVVTKNLTKEKAGLALRYDEWPGQTQIVIPLTDQKYAGTISSVDTTSISDKKVVEKMREDEDKDIEKRKEMVDLKERESEEAAKRAELAKKEAEAKQKEADKQKKEAEAKQKEADKQKQQTEQKQQEAKKAEEKAAKTGKPEDKKAAEEKQKEAVEAQKEAEKKTEEAKKAKETAEEEQKKADEAKQEVKEEEKMAEKKAEEAQTDRKNIASDTQKIIEDKKAEKKAEGDAAIASSIPGYGLKVVDESKMLSELVLLDLKTEEELRTSGINTIRGRNLYIVGKNLMAIAGTQSGNAVIALVLIDSKSLEIVKQSQENIAGESVLVKNENDYYAVIDNNGKYLIGRYNDKLELQAKSAVEVLPYTPITVGDKGLLVQDSKNSIRLLKLTDLTNIVVSETESK
ncbi:P83/100 family protein [Treponema putidum]|uniref:P83/100 family protein n=1 Tax=Treponema putidum TaxID=221027 RepID=UPI003D90C7DE